MNIRNVVTLVLVVVAFFVGIYWQRAIAPVQQPAAQSAPEAMPPDGPAPQFATGEPAGVGIEWDVPKRWSNRGATSMRLATYDVPAQGGGDPGECAVFYFGPGQGGDADSNIDRWIGQFERHGKVSRSAKTYGGLSVRLVEVEGDYLAPSGPMMESSGTKKGYMLKGAIVGGPNGNVFFKFTGPQKTVQAAAREFDGLLGSMRKS